MSGRVRSFGAAVGDVIEFHDGLFANFAAVQAASQQVGSNVLITIDASHIYVGTFTHNFEQLHYVYVKNGSGIEQALVGVYRASCPGCKTYTSITHDPEWSAYFDFLFPNQATREHYGLRLE